MKKQTDEPAAPTLPPIEGAKPFTVSDTSLDMMEMAGLVTAMMKGAKGEWSKGLPKRLEEPGGFKQEVAHMASAIDWLDRQKKLLTRLRKTFELLSAGKLAIRFEPPAKEEHPDNPWKIVLYELEKGEPIT